MKALRRKPTDAELGILTVLWSRGPSTVRQIAEDMGREAGYTTILKLLQIMTEKGARRPRRRRANSRLRRRRIHRIRRSASSSPICSNARSTGRRPSSSCRRSPRRQDVAGRPRRDQEAAARRRCASGERRHQAGRITMTPYLQTAGWALIHFVWQGAAIAGVASGAADGSRAADRRASAT